MFNFIKKRCYNCKYCRMNVYIKREEDKVKYNEIYVCKSFTGDQIVDRYYGCSSFDIHGKEQNRLSLVNFTAMEAMQYLGFGAVLKESDIKE